MRTVGRSLSLMRIGAFALAALAVGACDDDPIGPQPAVYGGEIEGVDAFEDLSGEVAIEVGEDAFEIGLALADYPDPGDGFPWILREGTCAAPGDEIGELADYPLIELDDDEWTDVVEIELDDDEDAYVIEIRRSEDEDDVVIACGELEQS